MDATNNWKKKCSFCGEDIDYNSRRCPYCGGLVGNNSNNINNVNNNGTLPADGYNNIPVNTPVNGNVGAGTDTQQVSNYEGASFNINEGQCRVNQEEAGRSVPEEDRYTASGYGNQTDPQADSQINAEAYSPINTQVNPYSSETAYNTSPEATVNGEVIRPDPKMFYGYQNNTGVREPLSNGMKVFLTIISTIPWIGQLAGIIAAIVFMNSEDDKDRKSFGVALLVASLVLFVVTTCFGCLIAMGMTKG